MYRYVFEHHVKTGEEADFIAKWKISSDIIQKQPGALGSRLFKQTNNEQALYVAMADWEKKADRSAALEVIRANGTKIEQHLQHVNETSVTEYELVDESLPIQ